MAWSNNDVVRFWKKIRKTKSCWEWTASTQDGYGRMGLNKGLILAHRFSWMIHYGDITGNLCVLHTCDNRRCVKPTHLFLGTRLDNNRDRVTKGRSSGGRNGGGLKGEANGRAKLSMHDVVTIRTLLLDGNSGASIARKYKVTKEAVYAIKHNRNWV